ncbi:hypothetical protein QBC44DRAFT_397812 [Cladorrhinum sp. PSN332]|nr:hypothetical protein QBC44DRAFT_397812 [Cladorrhinum sp. PSN332]
MTHKNEGNIFPRPFNPMWLIFQGGLVHPRPRRHEKIEVLGLWHHIVRYSGRELTKPEEDRLNALTGVFRALSKMSHMPIRQFWGIPVPTVLYYRPDELAQLSQEEDEDSDEIEDAREDQVGEAGEGIRHGALSWWWWSLFTSGGPKAICDSTRTKRDRGYKARELADGSTWGLDETFASQLLCFSTWGRVEGGKTSRLQLSEVSTVRFWFQRKDNGDFDRLTEAVLKSVNRYDGQPMQYTATLKIEGAYTCDVTIERHYLPRYGSFVDSGSSQEAAFLVFSQNPNFNDGKKRRLAWRVQFLSKLEGGSRSAVLVAPPSKSKSRSKSKLSSSSAKESSLFSFLLFSLGDNSLAKRGLILWNKHGQQQAERVGEVVLHAAYTLEGPSPLNHKSRTISRDIGGRRHFKDHFDFTRRTILIA